jgi:hypothetical protein
MDGTLFFLDGVNFQKTGEVFFETIETWDEQQSCPLSYLRSVEDFARTVLVGKGLAIGRDLPEVAPGVFPGDYLRSYIGELAYPIDNAGQGGRPDDLLNSRSQKRNVLKLVRRLADISPDDFVFWKELSIREARHVGIDPSILRRQDNPDLYKFDKRFCQDVDLRDAVPAAYLEQIMASIKGARKVVDPAVDPDALRTFFAENAVTHILTFQWYQQIIPSTTNDDSALYWPHATRSALVKSGINEYRVELPELLLPVLKKAARPIDVLDELLL